LKSKEELLKPDSSSTLFDYCGLTDLSELWMTKSTSNRAQSINHQMAAKLTIVFAGVLCYADSFQGAFVYDERDYIINNPTIRHVWPPWPALLAPINVNRPLIGLTNALNYAISGLNPWSYHAVNLLIHIVAALALFGIVHRTLSGVARFGKDSTALALVVALAWLVHPLQTESVTYVMQRCESLMGMFYLVALYCSVRSFDSPRKGLWYGAAIAACGAGMLSKQVMVTAPLMLLLYDLMFGARSVKEALRKRWVLYAGLATTWCILAATVIAAPVNDTAGFAVRTISSWDYCKSEFGVIVYYLRLSLWPNLLCFDYYGWPRARNAAEILPYAVIVGVLVAATTWAVIRRKPVGFLGVWFFLIISLTSSVMPFADLIVEHRMYLPLASVVALAVLGVYSTAQWLRDRVPALIRPQMCRPIALLLVTLVVGTLGCVTARRNIDYGNDVAMWRDVVKKRPDNARAHNNLGEVLAERNDFDDAIAEFSTGETIDPGRFDVHNNLGLALAMQGRPEEGRRELIEALRLKPSDPTAHLNLARVLNALGDTTGAIQEYSRAVQIKPDFAEAYLQLGFTLEKQGKTSEAKEQYQIVLELYPDSPELRERIAGLR
jgi:tetratricopeptide (TPR) repeat protein